MTWAELRVGDALVEHDPGSTLWLVTGKRRLISLTTGLEWDYSSLADNLISIKYYTVFRGSRQVFKGTQWVS